MHCTCKSCREKKILKKSGLREVPPKREFKEYYGIFRCGQFDKKILQVWLLNSDSKTIATLANYICKRFIKLTPDWLRKCLVHTNSFSFENAYISMRSGLPSALIRWEFSESGSKWNRIHLVLVWTVENGKKRMKVKTMTENITGAFVCSMHIEFNLRHNVQFYRFRTF